MMVMRNYELKEHTKMQRLAENAIAVSAALLATVFLPDLLTGTDPQPAAPRVSQFEIVSEEYGSQTATIYWPSEATRIDTEITPHGPICPTSLDGKSFDFNSPFCNEIADRVDPPTLHDIVPPLRVNNPILVAQRSPLVDGDCTRITTPYMHLISMADRAGCQHQHGSLEQRPPMD